MGPTGPGGLKRASGGSGVVVELVWSAMNRTLHVAAGTALTKAFSLFIFLPGLVFRLGELLKMKRIFSSNVMGDVPLP